MIIIPAIDIKDGMVVRLFQGKFKEATIYSRSPLEMALKWQDLGATLLHIVDLDGAATGELRNLNAIEILAEKVKVPIEVGGGIRTEDNILRLFNAGVARVVLGTKILEDAEFLKSCLVKWGKRIIVSIDSSHGKVANRGWTQISEFRSTDLAQKMEAAGVKELIYTEISRDGTLLGPNLNGIKSILEAVKIPVIASGGVSSLEDIKKLRELEPGGLKGVIIGKALYEEKISLQEALKLC